MVYLNKILMSSKDVSIPAPLFVTWYQCVITAIICYIYELVGKRSRSFTTHAGKSSGSSFYSQFPKAEYKAGTARRVLPLSIVFVGMITFNNLCLKYVELPFYNVARSLTIVFNVIFT